MNLYILFDAPSDIENKTGLAMKIFIVRIEETIVRVTAFFYDKIELTGKNN